jgi:L-iditol 2-dehydrogenase
VIVRVVSCGVSHHEAGVMAGKERAEDYPVVLGREVAGVVADLGRGVLTVKEGDRVAVYPTAACGSCFYCQREMHNLCLHESSLGSEIEGGLAEFVRVPREIVDLAGCVSTRALPLDQACLADQASDCLHAFELMRVRKGDVLAIIGSGQTALMYLLMAKTRQLRTIVCDANEENLRIAELLGADRIINPGIVEPSVEVRRMTGLGADAAILCETVTDGFNTALSVLRRGGIMAVSVAPSNLPAVEVDVRWVRHGQMSLCGVVGSTPWTFREAVGLMSTGEVDVNPLISHRVQLDDVPGLFQGDAAADVRKAIVEFPE